MIILAFDPGLTVGWAVFYGDSVLGQRFKQDRGEEIITNQCADSEVLDVISSHIPDVIVYEQFIARDKTKLDLTAVEVIGVIKQYANSQQREVELQAQQPSHAKFFWNNKKLKQLGMYKAGMPHANDALRHLLTYLTKHGDNKWVRRLIEK